MLETEKIRENGSTFFLEFIDSFLFEEKSVIIISLVLSHKIGMIRFIQFVSVNNKGSIY